MKKNSYYDIDAILAEEELIPCATQFDFSFLSHLDPDHVEHSKPSQQQQPQHVLPEGTRFQMPLWAVEKWAHLGYVRLAMPKHFGRKARERLLADPAQVNLRQRNPRYFLAGQRLVNLLEQHTSQVQKALVSSRSSSARDLAAIEYLQQQAQALRKTLLVAYTGTRLSHTLNWALSSVGDDVTAYTSQLTVMESGLYRAGAVAATQHAIWNQNTTSRELLLMGGVSSDTSSRSVTPDPEPAAKRRRSQ